MDDNTIIKYLQYKCSEQEQEEVHEWLNEDLSNMEYMEKIFLTLNFCDRAHVLLHTDVDMAFKAFKDRVGMRSPWSAFIVRCLKHRNVAAAFFVGVLISFLSLYLLLDTNTHDFVVETGLGQRVQTVLPDGSKAWLNSNTKLSYHTSLWSKKRDVDLIGEAYFEVSKNKHKAFVVSSSHVRTSVLGTKFNIRARLNENRVITTLLKGKVKVLTPDSLHRPAILLLPGESVEVNTKTFTAQLTKNEHSEDVLLWIKGKLQFNDDRFDKIVNQLQEIYHVQFVWDDTSLKSECFTGNFSLDGDVESILDIMRYTNKFTYDRKGNVIHIQSK